MKNLPCINCIVLSRCKAKLTIRAIKFKTMVESEEYCEEYMDEDSSINIYDDFNSFTLCRLLSSCDLLQKFLTVPTITKFRMPAESAKEKSERYYLDQLEKVFKEQLV